MSKLSVDLIEEIFLHLELHGCVEDAEHNVSVATQSQTPKFYTLYGVKENGESMAIHDWPKNYHNLKKVREAAEIMSDVLEIPFYDNVRAYKLNLPRHVYNLIWTQLRLTRGETDREALGKKLTDRLSISDLQLLHETPERDFVEIGKILAKRDNPAGTWMQTVWRPDTGEVKVQCVGTAEEVYATALKLSNHSTARMAMSLAVQHQSGAANVSMRLSPDTEWVVSFTPLTEYQAIRATSLAAKNELKNRDEGATIH